MSSKNYRPALSQGVQHVEYKFTMNPNAGSLGVTGPTLGEGDPNGSYVSVWRGSTGPYGDVKHGMGGFTGTTATGVGPTRGPVVGVTGTTGTYCVKTLDPFAALVYANAQIVINGGKAGTWTVEFGQPVWMLDNTWVIPFTTFSSGVATDLASDSQVFLSLRFRNGITLP